MFNFDEKCLFDEKSWFNENLGYITPLRKTDKKFQFENIMNNHSKNFPFDFIRLNR